MFVRKRILDVEALQSQFGLQCSQIMLKVDCSWADFNYILLQLDAYWLSAERRDLPIDQACAQWSDFDLSGMDFGGCIRKIGDILASCVKEGSLTYAEVTWFIVSGRASNSKWQLRQERARDDEEE